MSDRCTIPEIDHSFWLGISPDLYWPSLPTNLQWIDKLTEVNTRELVQNSYSGIYHISDSLQKCIIRETYGDRMLLENLAENEVKSILRLHEQGFVAEHYGFYIDFNEGGQVRYVIVTKQYPENWSKLIDLDGNILMKALRQILIALQIMQDHNIYHGALLPLNIYLDENFDIKLGNFFHSGKISRFDQEFSLMLRGLHLIDASFLAPEVKFAISGLRSNCLILPYNPIKADIFSLGSIILSIIPKTQIFNEIKIDSSLCKNKEINKSSTYNNKRARGTHLYKFIKKAIEELQEKIDPEIEKSSNGIVKQILLNIMQVYYEERIDYEEILEILENKPKLEQDVVEIMPSPDSNPEDPEYKIYSEIVKIFFSFIGELQGVPQSDSKMIQVLSATIRTMLSKYSRILETAKNQQLSCLIRSPTNIYHGLEVFFYRLFLLLEDETNIKNFLGQINPVLPKKVVATYTRVFNEICHFNEVLKDCVVSGLQDANLLDPRGWLFFFPKKFTTLPYAQVTSFAITQLANEFDAIIRCKFIEEELGNFITADAEVLSIYRNEILPNTFLANVFPGTTGYVTQNKRIFIKDYSRNNKDTSDSARGAIFVVLLHEITHFLRRLSCQFRSDISRNKTPPDESNPSAERREAGYKFEDSIFGSRVHFITNKAARFLMNHNCTTKDEFQAGFKKINVQEEGQTTIINRYARGTFKGVKCPMRNRP